MPKNGNIKKNVSKQVKKLNNKGGGKEDVIMEEYTKLFLSELKIKYPDIKEKIISEKFTALFKELQQQLQQISKKTVLDTNTNDKWWRQNPLRFFFPNNDVNHQPNHQPEQLVTILDLNSMQNLLDEFTLNQLIDLSNEILKFLIYIMKKHNFTIVTINKQNVKSIVTLYVITDSTKITTENSIINNTDEYNIKTLNYKIKIISESDRIKIGIDNLNSILKNNLESHISEECIVKPFFASFYTISNGMGDGAENDTRIEVCFPKSIEFTFQIKKPGGHELIKEQIEREMELFIQQRMDGIARGGKKHSKREVLGKTLIIYKINGDRKEYVKHKGKLITIKDYKALIKQKVKPKKKST